jgi:branched-chain amino acid aminotransferase
MMLEIPVSKDKMIEAVLQTLRKNKMPDAYIRLVVTRGVGDLGLDPRKCPNPSIIIIADVIKVHSEDAKSKGITAIISWTRRDPVDATSHELKSLNYLNSVLAKIEANNSGVDEAICLDRAGCICEGVGENLFIVKNGRLFTPPSSVGALPGITAKSVLTICKKLGYEVTETNLTPFQLFNADEVFFSGTAAEIVPIREVNKRQIGNIVPGPITKKIMAEFQEMTLDPKQGLHV